MADLVTLDVVDRPAAGLVRGTRRLHALARAEVPGLRAVVPGHRRLRPAGGPEADAPALILISGDLRGRHVPTFLRDGARVVGQAFEEDGYLGGLAVQRSPLNTTSCSAWRRYRDAVRYAYADGEHARAMRRDVEGEHHVTQWFSRLRPLAEHGTLGGRAPFASVI